jgi:hypothetical protein
MPILSWYDSALLISGLASVVGLCFFCQPQTVELTEAEAAQETLVRMTFVYWLVYCGAKFGEYVCAAGPQDWICSLHLLRLLSYLLTFCCVLSLPLHLIEQRHRQTDQRLR